MITKWKEISRETVFEKYGRGMESVVYEMPDGKEMDYILKKEGDAVCVLALTEDNHVILARQFRPGPGEILLELPGGALEKDEKPEEAIARELLEETGYVGDVEFVTSVPTCAYSSQRVYSFVATQCKKVAEQNLDENEYVDIELMSLDDFRTHARTGNFTDVNVAYLGLDYLGLL